MVNYITQRTLIGSRGFCNGCPRHHYQCPLGSVASYCIYPDVRTFRRRIILQYENINTSKDDLKRVILGTCPRLYDEAPPAFGAANGPSPPLNNAVRRRREFHGGKEYKLIPKCLSTEATRKKKKLTTHKDKAIPDPAFAPNSNIPAHVLAVWAPVLEEWFGYSLYSCTFVGYERMTLFVVCLFGETLLMTYSLRFSDNSRGYTDGDASTTPVQDTGSNTISIPLGTAASYLIHANG